MIKNSISKDIVVIKRFINRTMQDGRVEQARLSIVKSKEHHPVRKTFQTCNPDTIDWFSATYKSITDKHIDTCSPAFQYFSIKADRGLVLAVINMDMRPSAVILFKQKDPPPCRQRIDAGDYSFAYT